MLYKNRNGGRILSIFAYIAAFVVYCAIWCEIALAAKTFMVNVLQMLGIWRYVLAFLVVLCIATYDIIYIKDEFLDSEDKKGDAMFLALFTLSGIVSYPLVICVDSIMLFSIATVIIALCVIADRMHTSKYSE